MTVIRNIKEKPLVLAVALALLTTTNISVADVTKPAKDKNTAEDTKSVEKKPAKDKKDKNAAEVGNGSAKDNNILVDEDGNYFVTKNGMVVDKKFTGKTQINFWDESIANRNILSDQATMLVTGTAKSRLNTFSGSSQQHLSEAKEDERNTQGRKGPVSDSDIFTDSSKQIAENSATVLGAKFYKQASQTLGIGATSEKSSFMDLSTQTVGMGAQSFRDKFAGNAAQTIREGGTAQDTQFTDNASLNLEDGSESHNATFMDNSSAFIAPTARMTGTTTMNGSSFLGVFADEGLFGEEKKQLENVVLNNNSRLALLAVDGDDSHHVQAHEITMNGGTIVFGHDKDQPYTTLKAEKVGGSGGTVIMNGSLISGENDLLHVGIVTGNGAYSIILNNQDSGKELPTDLRKLLVIDQYDLNSAPTFNGPTVDQGTHKATLETKKDPNTGKTVVALVSDTKTTSWTTDAVMGLASASQYIFDGEMQALRTRRGDIQRFDQGAGGVWGRYLHNATDITAGAGSDYRLGQNGMELGGGQGI
ncbi:pertactin-like passenger domain-containing protein [Serratia symbiotica]|uniref:pertactin-like passenger domain-containing protein n=1 Tax=Serratia symbiotica TaxID=138074 RepID=UPI0013602797|nr:pertactin-like passenger domain-containing protein [Serratia symbiotica]MBQ0954813.1 hypothetical protein [Serratia symbiotica]